jgi:hypothetical protein
MVAVKAIGRRLRRLEDQVKPRVNEHGATPFDILRSALYASFEGRFLGCVTREHEVAILGPIVAGEAAFH